MAKNPVTLGLSAILGKTGEPTAANFTETGYTKFGYTYEDTAKMSQEDGESTEFYSEEEDDPIEQITKAGKITFNFSVMDPTLQFLQRVFGGAVAADVWSFPDAEAEIEESLIIKPRKGLMFQIPRAKIKAKLNGEFSKKGLMLVEVTATCMKPETAGLKKLYAKVIPASPKAST